MEKMEENVFVQTIQREKERLEKAKARANREGDKILTSILQALNRQSSEWALELTPFDEVIAFRNNANKIFLNLTTGEIEPGPFLTETTRAGLKVLAQQVKRKKKKWLRIRAKFKKAMKQATGITMSINQELDEIEKSIPADPDRR